MRQVHFGSSGSMRHKPIAVLRKMSTSCLFFLLTVSFSLLVHFSHATLDKTTTTITTTTDVSSSTLTKTTTTAAAASSSLRGTTTTTAAAAAAAAATSSSAITKRTNAALQQQQQMQQPSARVQQCREGCFEKFATKEVLCQQNSECLTCWDECAKPPPPKINKSIRETWTLHTVSMLSQDSLVLVDVAWLPQSTTPNQCLVTWEVAGGGLMGNLLTESFNVQLSLWPDTKYRVQVTCKNKFTGSMTRSLPLTIDTADSENALQLHAQRKTQAALKKTQHNLLDANRLAQKPAVASTFDVNMAEAHFDVHPRNDNVNMRQQEQEHSEENEVDDDNSDNHNSYNNNNHNSNGGLPPPPPPAPYDDDQSSDSLNQHTNFVFNWHARNSDISAIEPLQKPDLNLITIAALSDMQKPLLFGVIAGTFLLAFILLMYVCMLRQHRLPADKAALIDENCEAQTVVVSLPPAATSARTMQRTQESKCRDSATCSRNALKV